MKNLKGVKKESTTFMVVNAIKDALANGELVVGDRLPNEMELASTLGVGRSTLRESIKILEAYGFLEVRQGEGTFVVNKFAENVFELLGYLPNEENMRYIQDLRRVFETGCMQLAYKCFTPEECDKLDALNDSIDADNPVDMLQHNIEADSQFHRKLMKAPNNPFLWQIYHMMQKMLHVQMNYLMVHEEVARAAQIAHSKIIDALREKDREACVKAVNSHLTQVDQYMEKYLLPK